MTKWWALLFAVVMLLCGLSFFVAPWVGCWLPEGVSSHAADIDRLYYIILYITGFFFFLTEGLLVYFMYLYRSQPGHVYGTTNRAIPEAIRPLQNVLKLIPKYMHHQHRIEMAWTIVPAIILLYIAFAQVDTWANAKYLARAPGRSGTAVPLQIGVSARQFEWRMRYPSSQRLEQWLDPNRGPKTKADQDSFARHPQLDDVNLVNELHVWRDQPAFVSLSTRDVIHSFNIPTMRVKQDALPGREIPVWFTPTKGNTKEVGGQWLHGVGPATGEARPDLAWDLPCAELCGWGHYRMIANVYVHETREDFFNWLRSVEARSMPPTAKQ